MLDPRLLLRAQHNTQCCTSCLEGSWGQDSAAGFVKGLKDCAHVCNTAIDALAQVCHQPLCCLCIHQRLLDR